MSIYKIINGERIKLRHHIMVEMRENVSFTVQTEDSGCERQEFNSSSLKPLIKFRLGDVIVNLDENKVQAWYMAASVKDFFKVKIRIEEPYVRNLSKIEDEISRAFLDMPCDLVRGARLQDIPGNITSKTVFGMKKYLVFIVAFAAVTVTGCKDFLVEEPPLSQSNELTLSTYEGLDQATAGAYAPLAAAAWYGGDFILLNEMKTSNGKKYIGSDFDTGRLIDWYNMNYTEENTSALWGYAYYVISATNNVIANLTPDKGDEQDLNNLKAECLFLRAFSHFDLVRTYAQPYCYTEDASHPGVPVVITVQASTDKPARATVAKVYEQIVADLLEAESIIDPSYVRAGVKDQRSAVTLEAIQALLSRVYLYMENWQGAADYASHKGD